jgi:hypothetical protein
MWDVLKILFCLLVLLSPALLAVRVDLNSLDQD